MDLDIVEREVPITEENPEKSKRGLYKIKDNYLRFWFAFVYPNMSFIESGHIAYVYEDICRERLWELNADDVWSFHFTKLGRYWDAKTEIDIAAIDMEGKNLLLGECKYWQEPVGINVLRELEEKTKSVAWGQNRRKVWYVLFSVGGFTNDLKVLAAEREDVQLFDGLEPKLY